MGNILPEKSNSEFLKFCYAFFLGREPDSEWGKKYLEEMTEFKSRSDILAEFSTSEEFICRINTGNLFFNEAGQNTLKQFAPPGHFYSPIPSEEDVNLNFEKYSLPELFEPIIETRSQMRLIKKFLRYYNDLPFPESREEEFRYFYNNGSFNYFDGVILYSFLRHFKPENIIEVGSGFSSGLMIDTCEKFLENNVNITFIEPFPHYLNQNLKPGDDRRYKIIPKKVQDVSESEFYKLQKNDILFIDSSHVSKFGSDLNYLLFSIIPSINKGVIIHFHDIFKNFDYPKEWLSEGRAWNEGYILRAFLSDNKNYKILFFNDLFAHRHWDFLEKNMPVCTIQPTGSPFKNCGVSLWVRKE